MGWLQNEGLAAGLGRPDLAIGAQSYGVAGGAPPLVPGGGPASWLDYVTQPRIGQVSLSILGVLVIAMVAWYIWTYGVQK